MIVALKVCCYEVSCELPVGYDDYRFIGKQFLQSL